MTYRSRAAYEALARRKARRLGWSLTCRRGVYRLSENNCLVFDSTDLADILTWLEDHPGLDDGGQSTAVHEAGHAVIGEVLGCPVEFVTILPSGGQAGHTTPDTSDGIAPPTDHTIIGTLAGGLAAGTWTGCATDLLNTSDLLEEHVWHRPLSTIFDECMARATALVAEHSEAISRVARALLKRGRLSGTQVRRIVKAVA